MKIHTEINVKNRGGCSSAPCVVKPVNVANVAEKTRDGPYYLEIFPYTKRVTKISYLTNRIKYN